MAEWEENFFFLKKCLPFIWTFPTWNAILEFKLKGAQKKEKALNTRWPAKLAKGILFRVTCESVSLKKEKNIREGGNKKERDTQSGQVINLLADLFYDGWRKEPEESQSRDSSFYDYLLLSLSLSIFCVEREREGEMVDQ